MGGYNHLCIKENARTHYHNNAKTAIIVSFFGWICSAVVQFYMQDHWRDNWYDFFGIWDLSIGNWTIAGGFLTLFLLAVSIFISAPLVLGAAGWFQKSIYQPNLSAKMILRPFLHNYLNNVVTMLLKNVFIFLWSLLFLVPGIVKSYSYRMTEYIKSENPDIPPRRAIEMSMAMTDGAKGDLFYLDLSFFGWIILSVITINILGIFYVFPYYNAAVAFAYEELKAQAITNGRLYPAEFVSEGIVR